MSAVHRPFWRKHLLWPMVGLLGLNLAVGAAYTVRRGLRQRGINARAVGTVLGLPTSFPSVAAGTPAANNQVAIKLQNTGDAPLTITALAIQADALDVGAANDFAVVSQNCTAVGGGGDVVGLGQLAAAPMAGEAG